MKAGFDPDKDFGRVIFSGSHDSSAIAVQNRKVDAAAIADRILDARSRRGWSSARTWSRSGRSSPIPESPTVWRKDLGADLKQRVQAAFLHVKDIPWSDQGLLNGFHPTNDAAYNVIRDTARILKLDLGKMK
jgi:phosphonate transport system substrate-binding protein